MNLCYNLRRLASICLLALVPIVGNSQVSTYSFSTLSGTYTPITGGLLLGTTASDDERFVDPAVLTGGFTTTGVGLPIGFNFTFNAQVYDRVAINNNGWISFGSALLTPSVNNASSSGYTAISSTSTATPAHLRNRIAPFAGDLQGQAGSELRIETIGSAPNQVCVIQWAGYKKYGGGGTGDNFNFQIRLYETTNVVELVYGVMTNGTTASTPQVGLGGDLNSDFNNRTTTTDWSSTTAGAVNNATCTNSGAVFPASGTTFRWAVPPPTPPTPTQAPGTPTCSAGTTIDVVGTPGVDVSWYWQSLPNGTSTADLYAGPYTIFGNGTYYLRAFNTLTSTWSLNSSSVTVSDFPVAPAPPTPVAAANPACITDGTTISVPAAPLGYEYYWQGTNEFGTSTADNANVDYAVSVTGTYYVRAFDIASSCWSNPSGLLVTVSSVIPPAPNAAPASIFDCLGGSSIPLNATPTGLPLTYTLSMIDSWGDGWNGNTIDVLVDGIPVLTGVTLPTGTSGTLTFTAVEGGVVTTQFNAIGSFISECSFQILNQSMAVVASGNYAANIPPYTIPMGAYTIEWFDAAVAGSSLGTGSPLESVGTSVLPNTLTAGDYEFFASTLLAGCYSTTTLVTVSLSPVTVDLTPVSVTCNNGNDGTFTAGVPTCGTLPFTYSVDGGLFGAIPTDLTVGDHNVIVKDVFDQVSSVYVVTVGDAPAPTALMVNDFTYDMVDFSWTAGGSELQWYVEWGLAGFTPGTGTEVGSAIVSSPTHIASGLDGFTDYDFYVAANCGGSTTAGTWVSVSQTTLCDPIVAQGFCESFNSDSPTEACWTVKNANADVDFWTMNGTLAPYSGDQGAQIYTDFNAGNNDDWLITPLMTLTNNEILSFYYRAYSAGEPNNFEVRISTNGGMDPADFVDVILPLTTASNTTYVNQTIDLGAYGGDCYIAFHLPNGGLDGWYLMIDQVCIDICIPDAGTDGTTEACRVDNTLDLNTVITQGESNGVWEFLPNQGVISGSDLNLTLLPDGTYDFEYIVTTACTTDTTIASVTVHPASSAGNDGLIDDNCTNWSSINLTDGLSGTIDLGGAWTNVSGEGDLSGSLWTPSETTLAGSYDFQYIVSNGICPNDTSVVTVTLISCLGVDGNETVRISVYPNPVTDVLTIQNVSIETGVIEVLDVQGKVVSAVQLNGVYGNYALDMNNVQRGMYIVRITTENSVQEVRVVKH